MVYKLKVNFHLELFVHETINCPLYHAISMNRRNHSLKSHRKADLFERPLKRTEIVGYNCVAE